MLKESSCIRMLTLSCSPWCLISRVIGNVEFEQADGALVFQVVSTTNPSIQWS